MASFIKTLTDIIGSRRRGDYNKGIRAYNRGDYEKALNEFSQVTSQPSCRRSVHGNLAVFYSGQAHLNLGVLALWSGEYDGAIDHLSMSAEFNPGQFKTYHYLGMAYNNLGRYKEALDSFRMVQKINPDFLPVKNRLAIVFYNEARYDDARVELERMTKLHPEWADMHYHLALIYASTGQYQAGVDEMARAVEANPNYLKARIMLGVLLSYVDETDRGLAMLTEVGLERPNFADVQYYRGVLLSSAGRLEEAEQALESALAVNDNYLEAKFALALLAGARGSAERTVTLLRQVIAQNEHYSEAQFILKHLERLQASEHSRALDEMLTKFCTQWRDQLHRRVEIAPDFSDIINLFSPSQDKPLYESLIKIYRQAAEAHPDYPDVHDNLGVLYTKLEQYESAMESFSRALEANDRYIRARINLYRLYIKLGMYDQALAEIGVLEGRGIAFPDVLQDKGRTLLQLGQLAEAAEALEQSIAANPNVPASYKLLAQVQETMGRRDKAVGALERLMETKSKSDNSVDIAAWIDKLKEPV